jgi:hypothetical protein
MYRMYHSSVQNVLAIFETMPATDSSCSTTLAVPAALIYLAFICAGLRTCWVVFQ